MRQSLSSFPRALSNRFLRKQKKRKRQGTAIITVRGCLMLGSALNIFCLLYSRTVGSLPKRHRGCSNFFRLSITPGLSHFYPDTNGKYFPGLISTDQRHFLNREEPHGAGGRRSPRGNYLTEETQGTARSQWDAPRAGGASQDTIPARPGAVSKAINPFSSQLIC